jgi:hypothetical protein
VSRGNRGRAVTPSHAWALSRMKPECEW